MDVIKDNLILDIKKKLIEKQELLCTLEINSNSYNDIFNEILILKKELDLLYRLNIKPYDKLLNKLKEVNESYGFLYELPKDKLEVFLSVLDEYRNFTSTNFEKNVEFSTLLSEVKDKALLSEIKLNELKKSEEIKKVIDLIVKMKEDFLKDSKSLKDRLEILDFNYYNTLYLNVKKQEFTNISTLKYFSNFGEQTLVNLILKDRKEYHQLKRTMIKTKRTEERMELLRKRILEREINLIKNISSYILNNIITFKYRLNLDIDESNLTNFSSLYYEIIDKIDTKSLEYDKAIRNLKFFYDSFSRLESSFKERMNMISPNINENLVEKNIDVSSINRDTLNTVLAQINVFRKLNTFDIEKENERKFSF